MLSSREKDEIVAKQAINLTNGAVLPMVLKSALDLDLIEIISAAGAGAFLSPSDIAAQLPTKNPDAPVLLDRMLRLLASNSILTSSVRTGENGAVERLYGAGPICKFLRLNGDGGSVGPLFLLHHDKSIMESWYHLKDAILEGGIPFDRAHNMSAFEKTELDSRVNKLLNQGMSNHTTLVMNKILDIYKGFEHLNVLIDVGGGIGANLNAITSKYPHIKGINYDLPHVVAVAPSYPRVEYVGGDMFASVPEGGNAIFLKWVLHDWSDEHCLEILKNCYKSLPKDGKVIIVESILPDAPETTLESNIGSGQDLVMLTVHSQGKERTLKEFQYLAKNSKFSECKVICSIYNSWIIEFHK